MEYIISFFVIFCRYSQLFEKLSSNKKNYCQIITEEINYYYLTV